MERIPYTNTMTLTLSGLLLPAFISGLVMVFAPCGLSAIPVFLTVITGVSTQGREHPTAALRVKIFTRSVLFILTYAACIVSFGLLFQVFAAEFAATATYQILTYTAGIFFCIAALYQFGLRLPIAIPTPWQRIAIKTPDWAMPIVAALFLGISWLPCVGPVLGAVLTYTAAQGTSLPALLVASSFALGHTLPFLILGQVSSQVMIRVIQSKRAFKVLTLILGAAYGLFGLSIIINQTTGLQNILSQAPLFFENRL
jgi:cytochrome c-type biogenesis protein